MRQAHVIVGIAMLLAACGGSPLPAGETAVSRHFDDLAGAITGCAVEQRVCDKETDTCADAFGDCRQSAGAEAEQELADAIAACQDGAAGCRADAGSDAARACASRLRGCIGDSRMRSNHSKPDAATPNPNAPTYQCFGQLRTCVESSDPASECAASARACLVAAVGDPPRRPGSRPRPPTDGGADRGDAESPELDAGAEEAGSGGRAGAAGRAAGSAGAAGETGAAGQAGAAGRPSGEPSGPSSCMTAHEACLTRGEKRMTCARMQRECVKSMR